MTQKTKLTPAMRQYVRAKDGLSEDTVLFFRMGDFYELFFDDAKRAAPLMDIVLTQRAGVPMCGIPYHARRSYVAKILEHGIKVAIAEQVEDPSKAKGLVKREVTEVITPGTVLDEEVLSASVSNFLAAVSPAGETFGLGFLDVSTGDFRVIQVDDRNHLEIELCKISPSECIVPESFHEEIADKLSDAVSGRTVWSPLEDWLFDHEVASDRLKRHFGVASLDGFGCRGIDSAVCAAGALLYYAHNNLRRDIGHITGLKTYADDECMVLDPISQRNLELVEPIFADSRNSTLLSVLDCTVTPMGGRQMRDCILRPLRSCGEITRRLDAVGAFVADPMLLIEFREALGTVRDLERTITRLNLGSANARDLIVLRRGLEAVPGLRTLIEGLEGALLRELCGDLVDLPEVTELIARGIVDEPSSALTDGGIIREGFNSDLDELREAATAGKNWIADYQVREQQRTRIKSLKVRFNKVFGYFIEVTNPNLDLVPEDYIRKQTLTNSERYITPELKEIEDKILGAEEKSKQLEYDLFQEIRLQTVESTERIQGVARALGALDVLASLADVARRRGYTRPEVRDDSVVQISDGRHPVVEAMMKDERFVPNDTRMDTDTYQLLIVTGPNMAGKSTYIRQVALLVLMAQMGSFLPAGSAKIGLVDRIFTRVGAADDISRGQSTFMVEMVEAANILNNATANSLIILDELGRGTSTFDGLSLAWAVAEYLHDSPEAKARTLFATHYHELTELALTRSGVKNYNVAVKEQGEEVVFLRKIMPGGTDQSYGIHVARLAGLPEEVIQRASEVLENLEGEALEPTGTPKLARTRKSRKRKGDRFADHPTLFDF